MKALLKFVEKLLTEQSKILFNKLDTLHNDLEEIKKLLKKKEIDD